MGRLLNNCILIAVLLAPLSAFTQQRFHKLMPPGNYSGVCPLGNNGDFAVVSDKAETDGFYVFHFDIDTVSGKIVAVQNMGYRSAERPNRDMEAIAFFPAAGTVFIAGEKDNEVLEYKMDGQPTGRRLDMPKEISGKAKRNAGLESLTYSAMQHRFYTTTELPLKGDTLNRILTFDDNLKLAGEYLYKADAPITEKWLTGISELCALSDGRLLVLERQIHIPRLKIGATAVVRIYAVQPQANGKVLNKQLLHEQKTRLTLTSRKFANYEAMCQIAQNRLLLMADSQNRYKKVLRDWLQTIQLGAPQ